jgi:hypothetical protein
MAAGPKLVADCTEYGTEACRVPEALEPLQTAITPTDRLVRVLDPIVLAPAAKMGNAWQDGRFRGRIARQPVGHDCARHHSQSVQQFAKDGTAGGRKPGDPMRQRSDELTKCRRGQRSIDPAVSLYQLRTYAT